MNMNINVINNMLEGIRGNNESKKATTVESFFNVLDSKNEESSGIELVDDNSNHIDGNVAEFLAKLLSNFTDEEKAFIEVESDMTTINKLVSSIGNEDLGALSKLSNQIEEVINESLTEKEIQFITNKLEETNIKESNYTEEAMLHESIIKVVNKEENLYKALELNSLHKLNKVALKDTYMDTTEQYLELDMELLPDRSIKVVQDSNEEIKIIDIINEFTQYKTEETVESLDLNTSKNIAFEFNSKTSNKNNSEDTIENQINILNNMNFNIDINEAVNGESLQQIVINQDTIAEDIVQTVEYINNNNIEELTVKMNPKDLGEITISLLRGEAESKCIIKVKEEETLGLIKAGLEDIKQHLTSLDIPVTKIEVEMKSHNENDFSGNFNEQFSENKNQNRKNEKGTKTEIKHESIKNDKSSLESDIDLLA